MQKDLYNQYKNENFLIMKRYKVSQGATIIPAVWQIQRKQDIKTRKVKKYKSRLNLNVSNIKPGIYCDETKTYYLL